MISLDTLYELYEFNYWARDRQLQACSSLRPDQFLRPVGNSFSSVCDTLVHLLAVEWIWLERWRGRSPKQNDGSAFTAGNFQTIADKFPTLDSIREAWKPVEKGVWDYLGSLSEGDLSKPLTYTNFRGEVNTYLRWRLLFHLINHQTYHRGQITTLLRQLGADALQTDYLLALDLNFPK
ncbi:MAG TPA: DinB family protein [Terriglobia bacterium]|nr:DinB family protein [Terriglobia bacterium]